MCILFLGVSLIGIAFIICFNIRGINYVIMSKKITHIYQNCPENPTGIWGGSLTEVKCKFCLDFIYNPVWNEKNQFENEVKKWNYRKEFEKLIKEEK